MSTRVFRIAQMVCLPCGHEQRCRIEIEPEVVTEEGTVVAAREIMPECHSCGRRHSWVSVSLDFERIEREVAEEQQRQAAEDYRNGQRRWFGQMMRQAGIVFPGFTDYEEDE